LKYRDSPVAGTSQVTDLVQKIAQKDRTGQDKTRREGKGRDGKRRNEKGGEARRGEARRGEARRDLGRREVQSRGEGIEPYPGSTFISIPEERVSNNP